MMEEHEMKPQNHRVLAIPYEHMETPPPRALNQDEMKLAHFGKKQRFTRNFSLLSIIGLSSTLMSCWEGMVTLLQPLMNNGGPVGAFSAFLFVWFGVMMQCLVMSELGSMIPLSGGAYNWVAVLAPKEWANFASYMTGWLSVIAYQAASLSMFFLNSSIIQALAVMNYPDYRPEPWETLLIFYGLVLLGFIITTVGARVFPQLESLTLIAHMVTFFCLLITLTYLAPKNSASLVFHTFNNGGGFSSDAQAWLVGSSTIMYCFLGADAASHIAEEIKSAQTTIPKAMILSVSINGLLGIGMLVAITFCMGSMDDVLMSSSAYPFIDVIHKATDSMFATSVFTALLTTVITFGSIGFIATSSRMIWAFARERGLPGYQILSRVNEKASIPLWAIMTTCTINILLALISLGSTTAFNAFANLTVCSFYSIFLVAASIMLWKRCTTPSTDFLWGPFRLRSLGIPITVISIIYSTIGWIFSFYPSVAHPDAQTWNWSFTVYWAALILALVWWYASAKRHYTGPRIEINIYAERAQMARKKGLQ